MSRNAWLTPDEPLVPGVTCRVLRFPTQFLQYVMGALGELCNCWAWEQSGDMTQDECAGAMWDMWREIEDCDMIGSIVAFATAALPDNFLPCDGGTYDREDYPDLYAVLHSSLIVDADHFKTPGPSEGRCVIGSGSTYLPGMKGGSYRYTLGETQIPAHTHNIQKAYGNDVVSGYLGAIEALVITQTEEESSAYGGGGEYQVMQPYMVWRWGIRWR